MSRPKPKILMTNTNTKTCVNEQVIAVKCFYTVCYDGQPISLKAVHSLLNDQAPKYRKTCFPETPGHAINLANKLNKLFRTEKFQVFEMQPKICIDPIKYKNKG
jgi:hypothetical protein